MHPRAGQLPLQQLREPPQPSSEPPPVRVPTWAVTEPNACSRLPVTGFLPSRPQASLVDTHAACTDVDTNECFVGLAARPRIGGGRPGDASVCDRTDAYSLVLHPFECQDTPPAEFEAAFYAAQQTDPAGVGNQ
jgi:hypothetical protein